MSPKQVQLYVDVVGSDQPLDLGHALATPTGRGEVRIAVELSAAAAANAPQLVGTIDPDLPWLPGKHYAPSNVFGFLRDSSPDRWGRRL